MRVKIIKYNFKAQICKENALYFKAIYRKYLTNGGLNNRLTTLLG